MTARRLPVPQLPAALEWDHNAFYHRWLLRQLPAAPARVLDAGCGSGALASRLARRAGCVDAVDQAAAMIDLARARWPHASSVRWLTGDLLDPDLPLAPGGYDAVTALSSLHHLPLVPGLTRLASLVRPGGVLAVIGLYQDATAADYAFEAISLAANGAVGAALALSDPGGKAPDAGMPTRAAQATLTGVRAAARQLTPGGQIHRRVFWRYSLVWRRPPGGPVSR